MTKGKITRGLASLLLLGGALAGPAAAQQSSTDELKKEIESLKETLRAIQKDLQDIKALVGRQAPPPSGVNVVLDLAANPAKGERTAKLTLVAQHPPAPATDGLALDGVPEADATDNGLA